MRARPILLPIAVLLLVLPAPLVVTLAEGPSQPPPGSHGSSTMLPPFADVPEYRADQRRTGQEVGPGPVEKPVQVWSRTIDGGFGFRPILAGGMLLVGGSDDTFYAIDAHTGAERWRYHAADAIDGVGSAGADTVVFGSADDVLHAVDLATGIQRWQRPGMSRISVIDGDIVYSPTEDRHVYGLDIATGAVRWSWSAPADILGGALSVADGDLYVGVDDGRLYAVSLADGTERWHVQTIGKYANAVSVSDSQVFIATPLLTGEPVGELYVADRSTGAIAWTFRPPSGQNVGVGALGDGVAYVGTSNDGQYALPLTTPSDGSAPQALWQVPLAGRSFRGEVLTADTLYVPFLDAPGHIIALDPASGSQRWDLSVAGGPAGIVVSGGMLFEADDSGTVTAYAEPALKAAIGATTSGPLGSGPIAEPADPFNVVRTLKTSSTGIVTPLALDIGPDGLVYVLDTKPSVSVIDPSIGKVIRSWGSQGSGRGQFDLRVSDGNLGIGDIAAGPDGTVYVADGANHRIEVFTSDGTFVRQMGSFGTEEGQFSRTARVAVDDQSDVYVLDADQPQLTKFDPSGAFVWRIGGVGSGDPDLIANLADVTVLPDGRLLLLGDNAHILTLDPATGAVLERWGGPGRQPGELDSNCQISIDAAGDEYIFGCQPARTQVFSPDRQLLAGAYDPRDPVYVPAFGPSGEVFAILGGVASSDVYQLSIEVPAAAAASPSPGATLPTPGPESSVPSPTPSPAAPLPEGRYASSAETRPSTIPAPERRGAGP